MPGRVLLVLLLIAPVAAFAAPGDAPAPAPSPASPPAAPVTATPATPPSPTTPPAAAAAAAPPAVREDIHPSEATGVLGRDVKDIKGENVGRIVNVLVDPAGLPRAAVIEVGGFLGVGTRHIAVAWRALEFPPNMPQGSATLDMTFDQIKATPQYQDPASGKPVPVAAPPPVAPPAAQSH